MPNCDAGEEGENVISSDEDPLSMTLPGQPLPRDTVLDCSSGQDEDESFSDEESYEEAKLASSVKQVKLAIRHRSLSKLKTQLSNLNDKAYSEL